jgi:CheY-like chemotaxis protein
MSERSPRLGGPQRLALPRAPPPPLQPLAGLHVLVVDDDLGVRNVVTSTFELAGARVSGCGNGVQALDAVETDMPDVLVMDINLPGPNGFTVMRMIRHLDDPAAHAMPAIALSGSFEDFGVERMLYAGFNEWFRKPLSLERLVRAVGRLAGRAI